MQLEDERGFTLVELVLAVVISTIVITAMATAFIEILRNSGTADARRAESHDAQIAAAYFAEDVQSTGVRDTDVSATPQQSIETGVAYDEGLYRCGSDGTPRALLRMAWDEFTFDAATNSEVKTRVVVVYVVDTSGIERQLHRIVCRTTPPPAGPAPTAPSIDHVVVHNLDSSGPTVTCSSTCTAAAGPTRVN